jgi:hypothetical protein
LARDLSRDRDIDFAGERIDFAALKALARNPNLDVHGKIGFPTAYREAAEPLIFQDILRKLPALAETEGGCVVDIGPGCANLPKMIIELCAQRRHRLILVDSEEMLSQLPDVPGVTAKCPGAFPQNLRAVSGLAPKGACAVISYSVIQVVFLDGNPFDFIDGVASLLAPGGRALIGDIPNQSKRRRFFASETGKAFHRAFTGRDEDPPVDFNAPAPDKIDDAVLHGLMQRAQASGFDAYLAPQPPELPMANRRDDLLLIRP